MKEDLNMDKVIREKLESFSAEPPVHVWNNIQEELAGKRRKRRMAYIGWVAAAAVVVFAFIAGWMMNEKSMPLQETLVEKQANAPVEKQEIISSGEQDHISVPDEQKETEFAAADEKAPILPEKNKAENTAKIIKNKENTKTTLNENVILARNTTFEILETKTKVSFDSRSAELAERQVKKVQPQNILSNNDHLLIAENIKQSHADKNEEKGWVVGAHVSPGYSAHSSSYSSRYKQNMGQVSDGGVGNVGGGLSVQYKSSKRLSIESGLYYAQNSQSEGGSSGRLLAFAPSFEYATTGAIQGDDRVYSNEVRVSQQGIAMNSTAGVVNMRSTPDGAALSTLVNSKNDGYSTTLIADGDFSQEFDLVEIPLYLRYKLLEGKIGLDVLGGVNAGLIVGNNAYIENDFGKQNVGETQDISTLNFSGTLGFGVNYGFGKHFSFALEPRLNYYLNSINSNPDIDYKPYRIALFTGVYYAF